MPSIEDQDFQKRFESAHRAEKDPNNILRFFPFIDMDSYMEARLNEPRWQKTALTYFAYHGIKKQYANVDPQDIKQQKSFKEYIHFYEKGELKKDGDYETHLFILRQCKEGGERWSSSLGNIIGKVGDITSLFADKLPHPLGKGFKFTWAIFGNEIKDVLKGDPKEKFFDAASKFIQLHAKDGAAISAFMKEFPISDERIQKALWQADLKNHGLNDIEAAKLTQSLLHKLQTKLTAQIKGRQVTKKDIQDVFESEFKEYSSQLSGDMKNIKEQVGDLSLQLSRHLRTVESVKRPQSNFNYIESEIKGFSTCAQFLGEIAAFTHSPELDNAIKFMHGIAGITDALHKLNQLQTISNVPASTLASLDLAPIGPLALAGGYATVGLTALSLASSFIDQGPSGDQLILEFLESLADYIASEFKKVHEKLHLIHENMLKGFTSVLEASQKIYDLLSTTFKLVHELSYQVQELKKFLGLKLDVIRAEISVLDAYVKEGFEAMSIEKFNSHLAQLDDLLSKQNKDCTQSKNLLDEFVRDHLLGKSPIDFYTGIFYFDSNLFQELVPNDSSLFYSSLRKIDNSFLDNDKRVDQAARITKILSKHQLSSLLGFFAAYAEKILQEEYKTLSRIQKELDLLNHSIEVKEKDIETKKNTILLLSKPNATETEKKQKEQEQKDLDAISLYLESQKKERANLEKLKPIAEAAESRNFEHLDSIKEQVKIFSERKDKLAKHISYEKKLLERLETKIQRLFIGLEFLYHAEPTLTPGLFDLVAIYRDVYEQCLSALRGEAPVPKSELFGLLREKLGLVVNEEGVPIFDKASSPAGTYEKAFRLIAELFSQRKKKEALELKLKLYEQEETRLENSLRLAEIYERMPLTNGLVFNPDLWILATRKYLDVIQHPKLAACYRDDDLHHAHKLVVMGKNFLHFIHSLQESPKLFERLWQAYATTLISAHRYYQQKWQDYLNNSQIPNKDHLDVEAEFATQILDDSAFEEILLILDAQKKLLESFYQLVQTNNRVMWVIDHLLDKKEVRQQLQHLSQKERNKARFTTLDIYKDLNQAFLDIVKYRSNANLNTIDFIGAVEVSRLVTRLQRHIEFVTINKQAQFYDATSLLTLVDVLQTEDQQLHLQENGGSSMRDNFECLIISALEKAIMGNTNNAVLFVGETRAGKSSYIAYSLGCKMEFRDNRGSSDILVAIDCPTEKVPTIGHKPVPQTLFPAGYEKDGIMYVDFPGMEDSRPADEALLGVLATQVAIKTIKTIKQVVVVIDFNDIKNKNAKNLAKIVASMSKLFNNFKEHSGAITAVVSKLQGIKGKDVKEQKERIINDLIEFDKALQAGNYQADVPDPKLVSDFLSIFINSKTRSNLILFHPLNTQARDELREQITPSKGFLPDALNFVGDEEHKKQFFEKIQGSLSQATCVLEILLQYPDAKKKLEDELNQVVTAITTMEDVVNKAKQESEEPAVTKPYSEDRFQGKRKEFRDLDLELKKLVAKEAVLIDKINKIETKTDLVVIDTASWNEESEHPGDKGYPGSHTHTLARNGESYTHVKEEYTKVCESEHVYYNCIECYRDTRHHLSTADSYKDGKVRCFHHDHKIVDPNIIPKGLTVKNCKARASRAGVSGYLSDKTEDTAKGSYRATYHTPEPCYGKITVSFLIAERDRPQNKKDLAQYKQELKQVQDMISDKHAKQGEVEYDLIEMEKKNAKAVKDQGDVERRAAEKKNKLVNDEARLRELNSQQSQIEIKLAALKTEYDQNFKQYCENRSFWQRLIDLNNIIKFDLKQYMEFNEKFSAASLKIAETACHGFVNTLACQTFEEPLSQQEAHEKEDPQQSFAANEPEINICRDEICSSPVGCSEFIPDKFPIIPKENVNPLFIDTKQFESVKQTTQLTSKIEYQSSFMEQLPLLQWGMHYLSKWLPRNQERQLIYEELYDLYHYQESINEFLQKLTTLNNSLVGQSGLFSDELQWLEYRISSIQNAITDILTLGRASTAQLKELAQYAERITFVLEKLSDHQEQLNEWEKESTSLINQGKYIHISYDRINDVLNKRIADISEKSNSDNNLLPSFGRRLNQPEKKISSYFAYAQQFWQSGLDNHRQENPKLPAEEYKPRYLNRN